MLPADNRESRKGSDDTPMIKKNAVNAGADSPTAMWEGKHVGGGRTKRRTRKSATQLQSSALLDILTPPEETARNIRVKIKAEKGGKKEERPSGLVFLWKRSINSRDTRVVQ